MNRVEEILEEVFKPYGGLGYVLTNCGCSMVNMLFKKANEQTALEFTKWKDENYDKIGDNTYVLTELTFQELSQSEYESNFKTSEQLFNEWNNLNNK